MSMAARPDYVCTLLQNRGSGPHARQIPYLIDKPLIEPSTRTRGDLQARRADDAMNGVFGGAEQTGICQQHSEHEPDSDSDTAAGK
jgi:hypothetical protein